MGVTFPYIVGGNFLYMGCALSVEKCRHDQIFVGADIMNNSNWFSICLNIDETKWAVTILFTPNFKFYKDSAGKKMKIGKGW